MKVKPFLFSHTAVWIVCFVLYLCLCLFNADRVYGEKTSTDLSSGNSLPFLSIFTGMPQTMLSVLEASFSLESLPYWGIILGSSGLAYYYDEKFLLYIQKKGREAGIGNEDNTKTLFQIDRLTFRFPTDTGSALYFLGDGWLHIGNAVVFLTYGYFADESKAYNTGIQIMHGLLISTIFVQAIKISTGRESPNARSEERGHWTPFPSIEAYTNRTPHYDAVPSGHIATATLTFTILIENYPKYAYILRPIEIIWLTVLGLQMVNNGVHWLSDYPLGIAIGYIVGKKAAQLGKTKESSANPKSSWMLSPIYTGKAVGFNFSFQY